MNENLCQNEVSALLTGESNTNQALDSSKTFLDPFAILKFAIKILIGPYLHNLILTL